MSVSNINFESINAFFPLMGTVVIVGLVLWGAHLLLIARHPELGNERMFSRQLVMLGLTFTGVLAIALALPVSEGSLNQIIALIGLVISGIFAFSSSTIFANLMAGIMLRVTKPFTTGDFINVGEYFGRVVERGLLDTEIQTENRELVALPNTFMITNPIVVTRSSGTIVSTMLSLGYEIHHSKAESLLLDAAKECSLEEPFVQVLELGNYAVTYKISGMLTDVKSLLTARSNLRRYVLDTLHNNGVEIMSPAFMNQRRLPDELKIIPAGVKQKSVESTSVVEEVVFDKAEIAEQIEKEKQQLLDKIQQYKIDLADASEEDKKRIQEQMKASTEQLKAIQKTDVEASLDKLAQNKVNAAAADENSHTAE